MTIKIIENKGGTFRKLYNGKTEYRFSFVNERGEICRKSFTAEDEYTCLARAEEFLEKQAKINMGDDPDATLVDILREEYEQNYKMNFVGEQGYSRNLHTLSIIERNPIGEIPLTHLNEKYIKLFLGAITHYSASVISKVYQALNMAMNIAENKGMIDKNIIKVAGIKCPKSKKRTKKVRGFTREEQKMFVEALDNHKIMYGANTYIEQLKIELYTGMRMGEINALRPEDIDFDRKTINVDKTIARGLNNREFLKEGTKTDTGTRKVPMNSKVEPVLRKSLEKVRENPYGLIFYDYYKNSFVTTSQVNCYFRRVCSKAGIPYHGQHSLRHTFATRCIESGIPAIVLKTWLGHKNIHITLDTYSDVFDSMNFDAIEKFENLMEEVMANK